MSTPFVSCRYSLADVVGRGYLEAVCRARAAVSGETEAALLAQATEPVDFYPRNLHEQLLSRLPQVGQQVCSTFSDSATGAGTEAFAAATHPEAAPLTGYGFYRVGQDGRLYLLTKSEHYHTPLGHAFPGYQLLQTARLLGIPNATHNNTRGHITRLLEQALVAAAHGLSPDEAEPMPAVPKDESLGGLNRVLNLETGSLAVEAGLKLMLARFYRVQEGAPEPVHQGRLPVFLVMGDSDGGVSGNYHGTTVLTQLLRGMWPDLAAREMFRVCALRPNHVGDLEAAFERYERPPHKIAGFLHEIVMMNYGGVLLTPDFLHRAYELCAQHEVPTLVDEIQSCLWAPGLFQYREFGLRPSMVAVGKGFPGGEYAASRLLLSSALDTLPQFGALVTNGQEELASLAYLITMRWAQHNAKAVAQIGDDYEQRLRELAARHPATVAAINGRRHLAGVAFHDLQQARTFTAVLNEEGLDISVQAYKSQCPPAALTKLPLIACSTVVDFVIRRMEDALQMLARS